MLIRKTFGENRFGNGTATTFSILRGPYRDDIANPSHLTWQCECCKNDLQRLWKKANFDPQPTQNPLFIQKIRNRYNGAYGEKF